MPDVRVKICGLMRPRDARHAADAGADYLGAILSEGFGRSVPAVLARKFTQPGGPPLVAVFVDEPTGDAVAKARQVSASVLQLHGNESPVVVDELRREGSWELWKAVRQMILWLAGVHIHKWLGFRLLINLKRIISSRFHQFGLNLLISAQK